MINHKGPNKAEGICLVTIGAMLESLSACLFYVCLTLMPAKKLKTTTTPHWT